MATSYAGHGAPLPARAVVRLGAEIEEVPTRCAAKAVANDVIPWAVRAHGREWLMGDPGTRRNLNNGPICNIVTGDPNGLGEVGGGADTEPLPQTRAPLTTLVCLVTVHGTRIVTPNYLFSRKDFGLSPYWPTNAELVATALTMAQDSAHGARLASKTSKEQSCRERDRQSPWIADAKPVMDARETHGRLTGHSRETHRG
jgi:hypothetical protein